MIEIKSMYLDGHSFLGIYLHLPSYPLHMLVSTHTILAPYCFREEYFNDEKKRVSVLLCSGGQGFDGLLKGKIAACNPLAKQKGVIIGMTGKEALLLCEKHKAPSFP